MRRAPLKPADMSDQPCYECGKHHEGYCHPVLVAIEIGMCVALICWLLYMLYLTAVVA